MLFGGVLEARVVESSGCHGINSVQLRKKEDWGLRN